MGILDSGFRWIYENWQLKFAWLPHRCNLSDQFIWLKFAYRGRAEVFVRIDEPIPVRWHTTTEHLLWLLKR